MATTKPDPRWLPLMRGLKRLEKDAPGAFTHVVGSVGLYVELLDPPLGAQLIALGGLPAGPRPPRR